MKTLWTILNISKVIIWIAALVYFILWFGIWWGLAYYVGILLLCNILILTVIGLKQRQLKFLFKTVFSSKLYFPFTVYGCYCSPSYGAEEATGHLEPIDELDRACRDHDIEGRALVTRYKTEGMSEKDYYRERNAVDRRFLKRAITSKNYSTGIYFIGLIVGFLARMAARELFGTPIKAQK